MRVISYLKIKFCRFIAVCLFKLFGWKVRGEMPSLKKQVIIAAPHTSAWDYIIMIGAAWYYEITIAWIGKKELFAFWPLRKLFLVTGGIPIDRSKSNQIVSKLASHIRSQEVIHLCIPPEGSRSKREGWRSGFYYMALEAEVPITCSYIDFKTKTTGFGESFKPSGNIEDDIKIIQKFYEGKKGRFPEMQSPIRIIHRDRVENVPQDNLVKQVKF